MAVTGRTGWARGWAEDWGEGAACPVCLLCQSCPAVGSSVAGVKPGCSSKCMVGLGALADSWGPVPGRQPHSQLLGGRAACPHRQAHWAVPSLGMALNPQVPQKWESCGVLGTTEPWGSAGLRRRPGCSCLAPPGAVSPMSSRMPPEPCLARAWWPACWGAMALGPGCHPGCAAELALWALQAELIFPSGQEWRGRVRSPWAGWAQEPRHGARPAWPITLCWL